TRSGAVPPNRRRPQVLAPADAARFPMWRRAAVILVSNLSAAPRVQGAAHARPCCARFFTAIGLSATRSCVCRAAQRAARALPQASCKGERTCGEDEKQKGDRP